MSASHFFVPRPPALLRSSLAAVLALVAALLGFAGSAEALVRSPLTGEWVEELPPRPQPKPAPRSLFGGGAAPVPGGLYGTDGANLYLINKATGAASLIGPHGVPAAEFAIGALSFGPGGILYGTTMGHNVAKFYTIDTGTGVATAVGSGMTLPFVLEGGLGFVCNASRGVNELDLNNGEVKTFSVNTATGVGTRVGPAIGDDRDLNGLAYDGSKLWGIDRLTNTIGTVDFATGGYAAGATITVSGSPIAIGTTGGLASDPATGTLYAAFGSTGGLYTLNPITGAATLVGINNVAFDLAFAAIPATPTPTPTGTPIPTATPTPPAPLDHFMLYKAKPTSGVIPSFGPITLTDTFGAFSYDVKKLRRLAPPADKNGEGINDADTHLTEYKIRPHRGSPRFTGRNGITVTDQLGAKVVKLKKADAILVPTNKGLSSFPAQPTQPTHNVDHFVCYKAKGPVVNEQVQVQDQFESRNYLLKKVTRLCYPAAKTGTPVVVSGPNQGAAFPITPSTRRNNNRLVCYKAISRSGPHTKVSGLFLTNQFGQQRADTVREFEFCIPSIEAPVPTPTPGPSSTPVPTPTPVGPCQTPSPTPVYGSVSKAFLGSPKGLLD
jgi:hypothetical protein